jgi:HTH-type transcriptional regulator / antitoxin HigA
MMQNLKLERTIAAWSSLAKTVFVSCTEEEYEQLVELLDNLIDRVGEDESHPLAAMIDVIGVLIQNYKKHSVSGKLRGFSPEMQATRAVLTAVNLF